MNAFVWLDSTSMLRVKAEESCDDAEDARWIARGLVDVAATLLMIAHTSAMVVAACTKALQLQQAQGLQRASSLRQHNKRTKKNSNIFALGSKNSIPLPTVDCCRTPWHNSMSNALHQGLKRSGIGGCTRRGVVSGHFCKRMQPLMPVQPARASTKPFLVTAKGVYSSSSSSSSSSSA